VFYGNIGPETGQLDYCGAGNLAIFVASPTDVRQLPPSEPALGTEPYLEPSMKSVQLEAGDALVVVHDTRQGGKAGRRVLEQYREAISRFQSASAEELVAAVRSMMLDRVGGGSEVDWTILVAKRRG
jgi:serine phosphatase RsbU (regulator of sigma subunit)